ncbi:MAG TPA: integrin alpha, partial [Patescibacteria group bacterium]|nr:integrin alpha [Patescibacteria group bacterium]
MRPSRDPAAAETARQDDGARPDWLAKSSESLRQSEYDITLQPRSVLPNHPGGLQAANRMQDLRAYFLADGVDIVRRTEASPAWWLHLSLLESGSRGSRHPVEWAAPEAAGRVASFRRGDVVERWENTEQGILIHLELPGLDAGLRGEALLDVAGPMDLIVSADGTEAGFYHDGLRVARLSVSSPADESGGVRQARLEKTGGGLTLSYAGAGGEAASRLTLSLTGPGSTLTGRGLSTTPDWITDGNQTSASYGFSTATAGDVNGDGYSDVLVGAKDYDNGQTDEGRAFLFLGSPTGLSQSPSWSNEGNQAGAKYGISVSTAGDVNGDGYSDVIVGAQNWAAPGKPDAGKAYLYLGSSTGLSTAPVWTVEGDQTDAWLGDWVAEAGDVNGDGLSDVIIGAYRYDNGQFQEGRAYVYLGTTAGTGLALAPNWFAESDNDGAEFGQSVGTAGDVNGDGYSDVIVGAVQYTNGLNNQGRAYVFLGSPTGVAKNPAWTYKGDQASAFLGFSVGTAGDVNGDGYSDVVVGADMYDNGQTDEGRAYLFLGSATGLSLSPNWFVESNQTTAILGKQVTTAGDVNGDGYSDVIVGVRQWTNSQSREGAVWIYLGSPTGPSTTPDWMTFGGQANARFGGACATAGDVNGDGFSDVIVGASLYDNNGQVDEGRAYVYLGSSKGLSSTPAARRESDQDGARLGISVAPAGDINGDGYSDLILGADSYDNGEVDEGRALLFLGSSSGLASSPAWVAEGNQAGAHYGASVSQAGDVNGDGYGDVIVGAPGYDNGQTGQTDGGRADVYAGSAAGLSTAPIWTTEGDQDGAQLGASVAGAGDLDRDGFGDIIVGAPGYDNGQTDEGRATIYPGSASGPAPTASWSVEGNQDGAAFGSAVAAAGDVNGDGYADVIVGAPLFDNGEIDEGQVSLYTGSASGASTQPSWTAQSDQEGAHLGASVSTAGDVNGDGFSDLIAGAPLFDSATNTDEGLAVVYHGSPTGPGARGRAVIDHREPLVGVR